MAIFNKQEKNAAPAESQSASWGSLIIWVCMLAGLILMMVNYSHIY